LHRGVAVVEDQEVELRSWSLCNAMLKMKEDKQVDMRKTSLLELNSMDISYSSAKEAIINELEKCFLFLLKYP